MTDHAESVSPPQCSPRVSIVMPAYNAARFIGKAVDSILAQTYENFELIVVDDGSNDDTVAVLQSYDDERLRVLVNETNQGIPASRNKGIAAACGEFIAMHDADDTSHPQRIAKQAAYLLAHPDCAMVGTDRARVTSDGKTRRYLNQSKINTQPTFDSLLKHNCMIGASLMIRKQVFDELGGYASIALAEDYDLELRVAKKYKIANIAERLYFVIEHSASVTKRDVEKVTLFRRLVQNRNLGNLDEAQVAAIINNGIESYYAMLTEDERAHHHYRLSQQLRHQKRWCEALTHLLAFGALREVTAKMKLRIWMLKLKCRRETINAKPTDLQR